MRVLITGGAGFLGSQLAFHLRQRGNEILAMDNLVRRGSEINLKTFRRHGIEFVHGDVRSAEDFANLPGTIDLLCDASAQPSLVYGYANPMFDITNNTLGLVNALEFARRRNCPLIFCSTNRVYSAERVNALPIQERPTRLVWDKEKFRAQFGERGVPGFDPDHGFSEEFSVDGGQHGIYGLSKIMADLACQEYAHAFGVKTVINRFCNLAGAGQFGKSEQGWIAWWAVAFRFGLPLQYIGWGGKQVRDVLFAEDVCRLIEIEMERISQISGEVFNIGGGTRQTMSPMEATELLRRKTGSDVAVSVTAEARKADLGIFITDIRKAERVLGWKPRVGIEEGFDRIIAWVRENEADLRELYVDPEAPRRISAR
jgi:CDP-paratose 2-epimerase